MADHDPRAREIADNLALAVGNACCYLTTEPEVYLELRKATGDAIDVLRGRGSSGLRVVSAEPTEADVERMFCVMAWGDPVVPDYVQDAMRGNPALVERCRAAIAAFLAQGGGDAPP